MAFLFLYVIYNRSKEAKSPNGIWTFCELTTKLMRESTHRATGVTELISECQLPEIISLPKTSQNVNQYNLFSESLLPLKESSYIFSSVYCASLLSNYCCVSHRKFQSGSDYCHLIYESKYVLQDCLSPPTLA